MGSLFPPVENIRNVSAIVAEAVAQEIFDSNRATVKRPTGDLLEYIRGKMYKPQYWDKIVP